MPKITGRLPPVKIADLIPFEYRAKFPGFDESRECSFDLKLYEEFLQSGIRRLAHIRAIGYLRPRTKLQD
jgi:hypothetical protein